MPEPITWKDVSSFSQGDKERIPHSWEARVGPFRVAVHRRIQLPGLWFWSAFGIADCRQLNSREPEAAKVEALTTLAAELSPAVSALQSAGVWPEGVERG